MENVNGSINRDLKISSLGKSILDFSINKKQLYSIESCNQKQCQVMLDYESIEKKSESNVKFNFGERIKLIEINENAEKNKSKHKNEIKKDNDNYNENLISSENEIAYLKTDFSNDKKKNNLLKIKPNFLDSKNLKKNSKKFKKINIFEDKKGNHRNLKNLDKNTNIILVENQLIESTFEENMNIEVNQIKSKLNNESFSDIANSKNTANVAKTNENFDSSFTSIKNDLNSINNYPRKNSSKGHFPVKNIKINNNLVVQNSVKISIESNYDQIINSLSKEIIKKRNNRQQYSEEENLMFNLSFYDDKKIDREIFDHPGSINEEDIDSVNEVYIF